MKDYKILSSEVRACGQKNNIIANLEKEVTAHLNNGYLLVGTTYSVNGFHYQAVAK